MAIDTIPPFIMTIPDLSVFYGHSHGERFDFAESVKGHDFLILYGNAIFSIPQADAVYTSCAVSSFGGFVSTALPVQREMIVLRNIESYDRSFSLKMPLGVDISFEDGAWLAQAKHLGILAFGDTKAQAVASFSQDFGVLWNEIAQISDDKLTPSAIKTKQRLLGAVESVQTQTMCAH